MGEGAGALVLETEAHAKARGATPLAYLVGWGMSSDAEHITRPHPDGLGLKLAIEAALRRAEISPADVGYINPHATSTPQGDIAEYQSMLQVFGDALPRIPISATKSMIGHLLGGAGAAEAIAVVCSLRDQRLHPSINVDRLDPIFDIDLVREARRARRALRHFPTAPASAATTAYLLSNEPRTAAPRREFARTAPFARTAQDEMGDPLLRSMTRQSSEGAARRMAYSHLAIGKG